MAAAAQRRASEVVMDGRLVGKFPGLAGGLYTLDRHPTIITSTEMSWSSTATKKSQRLVPFNFTAVDLVTFLRTKPVGAAGKRKFQVGTVTSASLFFVTGNYFFSSATNTGLKRQGSATNWQSANVDCAATVVQFTLPPTATALSTNGSIYASLLVVAR